MPEPDELERWLARSLARPERTPDPAFVAAVARAVDAEALFAAQRAALWRGLGRDLAALAAFAAGLFLAALGWGGGARVSPAALAVGVAGLLALWLTLALRAPRGERIITGAFRLPLPTRA